MAYPPTKAFLWTCQQQMLDFAWDRGTLNASTNDSFEQIRKVEKSECPDHSVCGAGRQVRCRSNKCAAILLMPKTPAQMLQASTKPPASMRNLCEEALGQGISCVVYWQGDS